MALVSQATPSPWCTTRVVGLIRLVPYATCRSRTSTGRHYYLTVEAQAERAAKAQACVDRAANQAGPDLLRPVHEMVKTVDLEPHHCRWPYLEGPFLHCGLTKIPGSSYCSFNQNRSQNAFQLERGQLGFNLRKTWTSGTVKAVPAEFDAETV